MLRSVLFAVSLLALVSPAIASGKSPGAYANISVHDANACARSCADDGLCMAWIFHQSGACELTAVVPANAPPDDTAFGLASRAPAMPSFFNVQPASVEPATMAAAIPIPENAAPEAVLETDYSLQLLGGPDEGELRSRLSARQ